jgi:hypothetical protein
MTLKTDVIQNLYHMTDARGIIHIPSFTDRMPGILSIRMDWDGKDARDISQQYETLLTFLTEMTAWKDLLFPDAGKNSRLLNETQFRLYQKWLVPFDLSSFDRSTLHTIRVKKLAGTELTAAEKVLFHSWQKELDRQAEERIGSGLFAFEAVQAARSSLARGTIRGLNEEDSQALGIILAVHACGTAVL